MAPPAAAKPQPTSRVATRTTNADKHPGQQEVQKRKRRTKAEIRADKAEVERLKLEQQKKKAEGVRRIADIENAIAEEDANLVTPKPKPKPRSTRATNAVFPLDRNVSDDHSEVSTGVEEVGTTEDEFQPQTETEIDDIDDDIDEDIDVELNELRPKKRVKEAQGSVRDAVKAARKSSDSTPVDESHEDQGAAVNHHEKKKYVPITSSPFTFRMELTLDQTTLFYYSLNSNETTQKSSFVKNWAAKAGTFSAPSKPGTSTTSKSRTGAPSLVNASTRSSSTSALTSGVVINSNRKFDKLTNSTELSWPSADEEGIQGNFVDEDETKGAERDAAVASPFKGKVRATSSVCSMFLM